MVWGQLQMPSARIYDGFRPHRLIKRAYDGPWRFLNIGGGLRGGKSLGMGAEVDVWLPHSNLIWLAAETYNLTRQEFEYALEGAQSLDWVDSYTKPKSKYMPCAFTTTWGCDVETVSLHDLGTPQGAGMVARAPDLVIICEPGFAPEGTLKQMVERLATRRGRGILAGTFEQANAWFTDLWHSWVRYPNEDMGKSFSFPSWLNTFSFPGGRLDPELERQRRSYATIQEFLVRWGGVPLASPALVMANYWNPRAMVTENAQFVPLDNEGLKNPVYLMIDPGYSGNSRYAVLACHKFGQNMVVFDEIAAQTLVAEEVIAECKTRAWWPHVAGGIIDPYAGVNHVYGGLSPIELWWRHGKVPLTPAPRHEVEDIIARLQHVMRDPVSARTHLTVNPKCERLIWEMTHWRRQQTREGLGRPSDINCDAIKALAYFVSAKYTESTGASAEAEIVVSDFSFGGVNRGNYVSRADRYANKGDY